MSAACSGVKGHGIANVPNEWYEAGGHIDSALAVLSCAGDYVGSQGSSDHVANLIAAAHELLKLAKKDVDDIEQQLKTP